MMELLAILFKGAVIFVTLAASAVVLTRAGKNPYYALFWMIPVVQVVLLWIFAFREWPALKKDSRS